jgi:hypothetical protein
MPEQDRRLPLVDTGSSLHPEVTTLQQNTLRFR